MCKFGQLVQLQTFLAKSALYEGHFIEQIPKNQDQSLSWETKDILALC